MRVEDPCANIMAINSSHRDEAEHAGFDTSLADRSQVEMIEHNTKEDLEHEPELQIRRQSVRGISDATIAGMEKNLMFVDQYGR